jgi:hypothetical protein
MTSPHEHAPTDACALFGVPAPAERATIPYLRPARLLDPEELPR